MGCLVERSISSMEINQIVLSSVQPKSTGSLATFFYLHPVEVLLTLCVVFLLLFLVLGGLLYLRMQNAKAMSKALYLDALTGYPNYEALTREAPSLIRNSTEQYALLYLDIHQFKVINDTFGYETGDHVLIATSNILCQFLGPGERFARLYADTFALLLRYGTPGALRERVDALSERLRDFPSSGPGPVSPLFCGGIYPLPEGFTNLDQACDRANYAKDSILNHFSNTFVFYDDVMRSRALAEKELEGSMHSALENEEFLPFYQPKVNSLTGRVVGAEALVRWNHPKKGLLSPLEFLPFYEKNGFIVKIDLFIFERVCRDLHQWLQLGNAAVPVSVNFSRRHVRDSGLPPRLFEIAQRHQVPTSLLEVELTETEELENVESAVELVSALKCYGFGISIDDYGTGYSSISFLQQLPLDVLKLDRQFIINAMKSDKARDIMRCLVGAMQRNRIAVVCEGVETLEQLNFVMGLDCRFVQGFYYSPALPRAGFEEYLAHHGLESATNKNFPPIIDFERKHWNSAGDFLNKSMPSWIVCCSVEPGFPVLSISPNFLEGMGYSALEFEAATGGQYASWLHPDDPPYAPPEPPGPGATEPTRQYRLRKKDGSYLWVREVSKRVLSSNGQQALLCVCTNISDLVSLQAERLRLMDTIPGGVSELLLTEEGPIIQQATDRFYQVIGHSIAQMAALGNNLMRIVHPQDIPHVTEHLQKLLQRDAPTCSCSLRIFFPNGAPHWVSFQGCAYPSANGLHATAVIYDSDEEMKARQASEIAHTKLEMALTLARHAVFEYNLCTKVVDSHSGLELYGITGEAPLNAPELLFEGGFIHPDDVAHLRAVHRTLTAGQPHATLEIRIHSQYSVPDSPYLWVRITLSTIFDSSNHPVRVVGLVENINQQKHIESALRQETLFRKAFTESSLMAFEVNLTQDTLQRISGTRGFRLEEVCRTLPRPLKYSNVLPFSITALVAEEDRKRFAQEMSIESLLALHKMGISEHEWEYRRITPEGAVFWNSVFVHLSLDQLSGDVLCYTYHRDIHERKELEQELVEQASRDPLTGALNRASAERLIQSCLSHSLAPNRVQALLMMDFDHFKEFNDTYGHLTGDKCLILMTQAIQAALRADDIVARMGGDEFVVLLKNLPNECLAVELAKKLALAITKIPEELDITMQVGVSIGIALSPRHGVSFEDLYRNADLAMYQAKKKPADRIVLLNGETIYCEEKGGH